METKMAFRDYLQAMRKQMGDCRDIGEIMKMQDSLRDFLIEIMPFLINTQKGIRKKERLKRRFMEIVAERHGI